MKKTGVLRVMRNLKVRLGIGCNTKATEVCLFIKLITLNSLIKRYLIFGNIQEKIVTPFN